MTKRSASPEPWPTSYFAIVGAIVGIFGATISHLLHDHSRLDRDAVLPHFVPQLVAGVMVGSLVFGAISVARNWLRQRP